MHSSRTAHSIITAKLELDEAIQRNKDKSNKEAVLSTDLSMAFDTVEHKLLLSKLEHLGFRNNAYKIIESYLTERKFYTEKQGFTSPLEEMLAVSVIQGSKLSSLLYSLFTIDTLEYDNISKDPELFKMITGKDLEELKVI